MEHTRNLAEPTHFWNLKLEDRKLWNYAKTITKYAREAMKTPDHRLTRKRLENLEYAIHWAGFTSVQTACREGVWGYEYDEIEKDFATFLSQIKAISWHGEEAEVNQAAQILDQWRRKNSSIF